MQLNGETTFDDNIKHEQLAELECSCTDARKVTSLGSRSLHSTVSSMVRYSAVNHSRVCPAS